MEGKKVSESRTIQTYLLMPQHLNAAGLLFGGQLLSWIDMSAGIVALRHADTNIVTVAVDNLEFKESARSSDVVTLDARVTWTGRTSMEIRIDTYKENKGGKKYLINTAYLVMVAINSAGEKKEIPPIIPETEEEKREYEAAVLRNQERQIRRRRDVIV